MSKRVKASELGKVPSDGQVITIKGELVFNGQFKWGDGDVAQKWAVLVSEDCPLKSATDVVSVIGFRTEIRRFMAGLRLVSIDLAVAQGLPIVRRDAAGGRMVLALSGTKPENGTLVTVTGKLQVSPRSDKPGTHNYSLVLTSTKDASWDSAPDFGGM